MLHAPILCSGLVNRLPSLAVLSVCQQGFANNLLTADGDKLILYLQLTLPFND